MHDSQDKASPRFHGLDTLRALAILLVVPYHLHLQGLLPQILDAVAQVGWVGVDLFFVLSGFLIGSQLFRPYLTGHRPSLRAFYVRRAFRILPSFFVVFLLYWAVPLWREAAGLRAPWQYATFMWNLLLIGYPDERAFSHVWSLCVEEHFYLFFPVLVVLLMRRPAVWKAASALVLLVCGGLVFRVCMLHHILQVADDRQGFLMMKYIYYPTYSRLDGLVAGIGLAALRSFRPQWWLRFTRYGNALALVGLACVVAGLSMCGFIFPDPSEPASIVFAFPTLACGFGLLVASAVSEKGLLRTRIPGASMLAALAFNLYLTHKSVAHATHLLLPGLTVHAGWRSFGIYVATCLAVAAVLHFAIERPCIALRVRHSRRDAAAQVDKEIQLDPAI